MKGLRPALQKIRSIFTRADDVVSVSIEEVLIRADVGVKYAAAINARLQGAKGDRITVLKQEITDLLSRRGPAPSGRRPSIVLVSGVNGSGKTTTVAKLANLYRRQDSVLLVSGDTYRDAAHEQLEIWAGRAGVETVGSRRGQDAAAVIHDALTKALSRDTGYVVIDTAGRLHTRSDLMGELKKIVRVIMKFRPTGPDLNILTIDANLGQNSIQQARVFAEAIAVNGLVLTKMDGTAKGGAIIPISNELRLPVLYLGVGEGIEDIVEFEPREFVEALLA